MLFHSSDQPYPAASPAPAPDRRAVIQPPMRGGGGEDGGGFERLVEHWNLRVAGFCEGVVSGIPVKNFNRSPVTCCFKSALSRRGLAKS